MRFISGEKSLRKCSAVIKTLSVNRVLDEESLQAMDERYKEILAKISPEELLKMDEYIRQQRQLNVEKFAELDALSREMFGLNNADDMIMLFTQRIVEIKKNQDLANQQVNW